MSGVGRIGRSGMRVLGGAAKKTSLFLGRGLLGFASGAIQQGIANFEQIQNARLEAASILGGGAQFSGGTAFGFNRAQAARVQAQAAQAGVGDARTGFMLNRALGSTGIQTAGGIAGRQGVSGGNALRQLSGALSVAMETGLSRARVPEFLQTANQLSEQQLLQTPDKKSFKSIVQEMATLQGVGLSGRFAGQALGQANKAIQGATGASQAFLMRAFGFGQGGRGLVDVLKMQEQGALGGNMSRVMKQLVAEYGAGEGGGLSEAGKLAFKSMGLGSISMAEKFSQAYLQGGGKLSKEQIEKIQQKEMERKKPKIEIDAYRAMKNFGGVAKSLAAKFDKYAEQGKAAYVVVGKLRDIQGKMSDVLLPLVSAASTVLVPALTTIQSLLPQMGEGIKTMLSYVKGIANYFGANPIADAARQSLSQKQTSKSNLLKRITFSEQKTLYSLLAKGRTQTLTKEEEMRLRAVQLKLDQTDVTQARYAQRIEVIVKKSSNARAVKVKVAKAQKSTQSGKAQK